MPKPLIFGYTRWEFAKADVINDPLWRHHKADMDAHVPIEIFVYEHTRSDGCLMRCRVDAEPMFKGARFLGYKGTAVVLNLSSA